MKCATTTSGFLDTLEMLSTALDLPKCTEWRLTPLYLARKENVGLKIRKDLETSRIYQYFLKMESPLEVMGKE